MVIQLHDKEVVDALQRMAEQRRISLDQLVLDLLRPFASPSTPKKDPQGFQVILDDFHRKHPGFKGTKITKEDYDEIFE